MRRDDLIDLNAFAAVSEERNFTRAAARLGTSQSALSHAVRRLETRLGVRLLTRTTRNVMPTEAGERLLGALRPALEAIDTELASLSALRDKPAGAVRISTGAHAAHTVLWPALERFLPRYPDIKVEISLDQGLTDIVAQRFDAGVRLGESIDRDMIATPIGPDLRMAAVGAPAYFEGRPRPATPHDLTDHDCINLRLPTLGETKVRVEGRLIFNDPPSMIRAAAAGFGLAFVMEDQVAAQLASGALVRVLEDWCPPFAGYQLYYPSRRQLSPAFVLLVEALRYRGAR